MSFLVVLLALTGCDNGNNDDQDAGMHDSGMSNPDGGMQDHDSGMTEHDSGTSPDGGQTDAGGDGGVAIGCGARLVALAMGDQTITGDTSGMGSDLTLSDVCGAEPAPQEVIAVTVPGTGRKDVFFTLVNDATSPDFDTVVEVRTGACDSAEGALCFDQAGGGGIENRTEGWFAAEGGSTVYLVVSGYDSTYSGPWSMDVTVADVSPPTFTGGDAYRVGGAQYDFRVDGGDTGRDAAGIRVSFLDSTGTVIGIDYDDDTATPDETELDLAFDTPVIGASTFTDALVRIDDSIIVSATTAATQARVQILDRLLSPSDPMTLTIHDVTVAGARGDACSADVICPDEYFACTADVCSIPAATLAACSAATAVTVAPDAPASVTGSIELGASFLQASCETSDTSGPEDLYTVVVPDGAYDLIASTDNAATGSADTVLYVVGECGEPRSELDCNDDSGDASRSTVTVQDIAAGTYTIGVEIYGGPAVTTSYQLDVRLRPVIGEGVACDPAEVMNRCSTGACPAGTSPVCPAPPPT